MEEQGVQTETPRYEGYRNPNPWVNNPHWAQVHRSAKYALHLMEPHKRPLAWYHCRGWHDGQWCQMYIMAMDVDNQTISCPECGHPWRYAIMDSQPCVAPLGDDANVFEPGQNTIPNQNVRNQNVFYISYISLLPPYP